MTATKREVLLIGTAKAMTAGDARGFYALKSFFSTRKWGKFYPHFGVISLLNCKKSNGENSNNPVETATRNCRFLSLVMVERVLILEGYCEASCKAFQQGNGVLRSGPRRERVSQIFSEDA